MTMTPSQALGWRKIHKQTHKHTPNIHARLSFRAKFPCKFTGCFGVISFSSSSSSTAIACFFCFLFHSCCFLQWQQTTTQTRNFECVYRVYTRRSNIWMPHTHNVIFFLILTKDTAPCSNDYIVTWARHSTFKHIKYTSLVLATLICMHASLIKYIAPSNKMEYFVCWLRLWI